MVKINLILCFLILSFVSKGQASGLHKIVYTDSTKQVLNYTGDSLLKNVSIFKLDKVTNEYELYQTIDFNGDGSISSVYSYYGIKRLKDGNIAYDQFVVDINNSGKPIRVFLTEEFKTFKYIILKNGRFICL